MSDAPLPKDMTRDEFLTARQLAAILQVSESTVRRLARGGRIPSVRITPRIMRFHLQSVREALGGANRQHKTRRAVTDADGDTPQLSFRDLL